MATKEYSPICLFVRHFEPEEVFELFRAADLCIVSSLHDGMNLVAKEFVAARDDEQGLLILCDFAGPQMAEFLRLKRRYDLDDVFQSDWYRYYKNMFSDQL